MGKLLCACLRVAMGDTDHNKTHKLRGDWSNEVNARHPTDRLVAIATL